MEPGREPGQYGGEGTCRLSRPTTPLSPSSGTTTLPDGRPGHDLVDRWSCWWNSVKVSHRVCVLALVVASVPVMLSGCTAKQVAVACGVGTHHPPGQKGTCVTNATPAIRAKLLTAARQTARDNHGIAQRVVAVESADADVNAFLNVHGLSTGAQVEWVVQASGHFKCGPDCFSNEPTSGKSERVLTLVIDSTTLRESAFEYSNDWVNLSKIGTVVVLQT